MSSLFGAAMGASLNAMEGAAIGRAIGGANSRADHAENQAQVWYEHAQKLDAQINQLKYDLNISRQTQAQLADKLAVATKALDKLRTDAMAVVADGDKMLLVNTRYGSEIKARLRQMEKALQHSSADRASVTYMLNVYKELFGDFSMLSANGSISQETKEKAEAVWSTYMNGSTLTDSQPIQDIIDKAPMPVKHRSVSF
jgi:predicted  nucleic acid-binding Zn-ribbon protein